MQTLLITGSDRGLGLEWVRQCAERGWRIHAACRAPDRAESLQDLASRYPEVSVHSLDVTDPEQIGSLAEDLEEVTLDLLINNAGVYFERWGKDPVGSIDYDAWQETFRVNTLGPLRVTEAFVPHLSRSNRPLVLAISSNMGSIATIDVPRDYAYRSSKAALNAAMHGLSLELKDRGIGVLIVHPGWVRTRMGGSSAPLSAQESVSGMLSLVDGFDPHMSGSFVGFDGATLPW